MIENKDIEQARALHYKFFGAIYSFIDSQKQIDDILKMLELFLDNPINDDFKNASKKMYEFLKVDGLQKLKNESNSVFVSPESTFIPMSASYFDEGRDDGQKRVKVAEFVFGSKFRKNEFASNDSEDNIVFLFEFMYTLIKSAVSDDEQSLDISHKVFEEILNDFLNDFANILYVHEDTDFYKNSAVLLNIFIEFERFYLDVEPSKKTASKEKVSAAIKKDRKPFTKRVERDLDEIVL